MRALLPCSILLLLPASAHAAGRPNIEKFAKDCREGKWVGCVKLMDVATSNPDKAVRSAAIGAVPDQEVLNRIVTSPGFLDSRLEALARINEPERLVQIVLRSGGDQTGLALRAAAVARITAPANLIRLAKEADEATAVAAVGRLDQEAAVVEVYKAVVDKKDSIRDERPVIEAAVEKMTDRVFLAEIAAAGSVYDGKAWLRTLALDRIHDPPILLRLAKSKAPVAKDAVKSLRDQAAMADAALGAEDIGARSEAINRLGDQAVLARIARGHPLNPQGAPSLGQTPVLTWEQDSAIKGLTDRAALAELARSKNTAIARAAGQRLAAVKATVMVDASGDLFEPRLGQPLAQYRVEAVSDSGRLVGEATTDGEGRFKLHGLSPGRWTLVHGPEKAVINVPTAGGGLGRVPFRDAALVTSAFGPVCRTPGPTERVPGVPLLVLTTTERHAGAVWRPDESSFAWDRPWTAILCLRTSSTEVGRYLDQRGLETGRAYRVNWEARLVRLRDGHVFEASFAEDPPDKTSSGMGVGNPSAKLAAWLKTIE